MIKQTYNEYLKILNFNSLPDDIKKYFEVPSLLRLKNIGYFCGMDYASKHIYNFGEYISRFDHSVTVALLVWNYTKDKTQTLAGLFHDVGTPVFSHVIDYMNNDYESQESTEEYTEFIIKDDEKLVTYLKEDNIELDEIINFKKHSIVDNDRPKLCADRLDGIFLTGLFWTKDLNIEDVKEIYRDTIILNNEDNFKEIGFKTKEIAEKVLKISNKIDEYCHSYEDNYMMELLAILTEYIIKNGYIKYKDLYYYKEKDILNIIERINDKEFKDKYNRFKSIKKEDIKIFDIPKIKKRDLNPLVNNQRIKDIIE